MNIKNFFSKTKALESGCVVWTANKTNGGYGRFRNGKRLVLAHRFLWEWINGPIDDGLLVCHKCDNPTCVNIDHLFVGTHKDNSDDKISKGRWSNGDRRGTERGKSKDWLEAARVYFSENPTASAREWIASGNCPVKSPTTASAYKKAVVNA